MEDEEMSEVDPFPPREESHEVPLHLLGVLPPAQSQPPRDPLDVGVDDDAVGNPVRDPEDDVGCLSRDPGERQKFLHGPRHGALERLGDPLRGGADRFGLVSVKASRANDLLERFLADPAHRGGVRIPREKLRGHHVHPGVRALGRKNRRDEELEGVLVGEGARGIGVGLPQPLDQSPRFHSVLAAIRWEEVARMVEPVLGF